MTSLEMAASCDPASVVLSDFPQWQQEEGYWLGDLSFYQSDGTAYNSSSWNYPYDHYKGFITGSVNGSAYRQRNVFMYQPQSSAACALNNAVQGAGACGINGNQKVFEADQTATVCSLNPELGGDIEGPFGSMTYTTTELVGRSNALLYQVWLTADSLNLFEAVVLGNPYGRCNEISAADPPADQDGTAVTVWDCGYAEDRLMQSQLTTLTELPDGTPLRTRTAQGFDAFVNVGKPTYASFYREQKVSQATFYEAFNQTVADYNILESDLCKWASGDSGGIISSSITPGFAGCSAHLEASFELEAPLHIPSAASSIKATSTACLLIGGALAATTQLHRAG